VGLVVGDNVVDLQKATASYLSSAEEAEAVVGHTLAGFLERAGAARHMAGKVLGFA